MNAPSSSNWFYLPDCCGTKCASGVCNCDVDCLQRAYWHANAILRSLKCVGRAATTTLPIRHVLRNMSLCHYMQILWNGLRFVCDEFHYFHCCYLLLSAHCSLLIAYYYYLWIFISAFFNNGLRIVDLFVFLLSFQSLVPRAFSICASISLLRFREHRTLCSCCCYSFSSVSVRRQNEHFVWHKFLHKFFAHHLHSSIHHTK